ncbi:MAG TPA: hypothetical protein VFO25_06570 [Candidatus Eremiobacteraceae bacterium]|nr:hypothetical protein [Candidatus Eremiobacteraceae bacterium]
MLKRDFLKVLGFAGSIAPLASIEPAYAAETDADPDALVGLWEAVITGGSTYRYFYAISRGSYVATGSVDEQFQGFKFSPTIGAYARNDDGSFGYLEKGYVFDLKGVDVGTFVSKGVMRLNAAGDTLHGTGTFRQFDVHSKEIFTEPFTMTASRQKI